MIPISTHGSSSNLDDTKQLEVVLLFTVMHEDKKKFISFIQMLWLRGLFLLLLRLVATYHYHYMEPLSNQL